MFTKKRVHSVFLYLTHNNCNKENNNRLKIANSAYGKQKCWLNMLILKFTYILLFIQTRN